MRNQVSEPARTARPDAQARSDRGPRRSGNRAAARQPYGKRGRPAGAARSAIPVKETDGDQRAKRPGTDPDEKTRPGTTRMFASVLPGMAPLVRRQLDRLPGVRVTSAGFDGRSDIVLFDVDRGNREQLWTLRTIEDLFIEVGRTLRSSGDRPYWIAQRIWRPERVERALSQWSGEVRRPLVRMMTYRVIARVLRERSFLRTELREALSQVISADKPHWRSTDPAQVEVWISEYQPGKIVAGLRLSDRAMRQHDGREVERRGALRPTLAAMMVSLAGVPGGTLLDPCCGSGTILAEALAAGWERVRGRDIDSDAVAIARRNVPGAQVQQGDLRDLDLPAASVDAVVANLPFGRQFEVQEPVAAWLSDALTELARVTRQDGRLVLLAPTIPADSCPLSLRLRSRDKVKLLGTRTTLWVFDRIPDADAGHCGPSART